MLAWDVPGDKGVGLRGSALPQHRETIRALWEQGHAVLGAGILDDAGVARGSLVVMDYPDRADLDAYLANEPFVKEGVWEKVEVHPLRVGDFYLGPGSRLAGNG